MKFINLTKNDILYKDEDTEIRFFKSGKVAKVEFILEEFESTDGIKLFKKKYKNFSGLPEFEEGIKLIVSNLFLEAVKNEGYDDLDLFITPNLLTSSIITTHEGKFLVVDSFITASN